METDGRIRITKRVMLKDGKSPQRWVCRRICTDREIENCYAASHSGKVVPHGMLLQYLVLRGHFSTLNQIPDFHLHPKLHIILSLYLTLKTTASLSLTYF